MTSKSERKKAINKEKFNEEFQDSTAQFNVLEGYKNLQSLEKGKEYQMKCRTCKIKVR